MKNSVMLLSALQATAASILVFTLEIKCFIRVYIEILAGLLNVSFIHGIKQVTAIFSQDWFNYNAV